MSNEERRQPLSDPKTFEELSARVAVLEALAYGANLYIVQACLANADPPQARQHIEALARLSGGAAHHLGEDARKIAMGFANDVLRVLESLVVDAEVTTQKPN